MPFTQKPVVIKRDGTPLVCVRGEFYRAVDPAYENSALDGSRAAGRYSPHNMRTLYLSSSPEGVDAAMIAHSSERSPELKVMAFEVTAERIADLRDADAMARLGVDPDEAAADWQGDLAAGRIPKPWAVRDTLEKAGAAGLIDPSRKRPGLWHLTLFSWNTSGVTQVHPAWRKTAR
jgi:RES domain-containing protein